MSTELAGKQIAALNAAGETLKGLGIGTVRLRYRPADDLITRDTFSLWIEDGAGLNIGCGDTPEAALFDALEKQKMLRPA